MFNSNQTDPNQHLGVLPSGWEMIFDHKTGWPYFVDHNTHTTSWEDPRLNPAFKMQYPQSGLNYPVAGDQQLREIPVMHESSRHTPQHPGAQWQQYPQSRTPPRVSTPPRVGTPPRTEGASPRFYTLPRNHKERVQDAVREIPIQHFSSSRPMSPAKQGYPDMTVPRPDYPGSQAQQDIRYPPQQLSGQMPRATGQAQTYPQNMANQQYPQSYPTPGYPQGHQGYPHGQGYPQRPAAHQAQGPPMPQPQGPPVSQAPYPQPQQQPYPTQQPRPQMPQPQGHQPSPPPASQRQCRPPEQQQEVYNIPIIREMPKHPNQPSEPQSRQYTPERQNQSETQQGNKDTHPEAGNRTRESSYDQADSGVASGNTNSNGQKKEAMSSNQNPNEQRKKEPRTSLDDIRDILAGCKQYEEKVMTFNGRKSDREYKLLEEMMTRGILKLDGIESGSDDAIRQARKAAVREIQSYLDQLELKAFSEEVAKDKRVNDAQTLNGANEGQTEAMDATNTDGKSNTKVKEMVLESEITC